jgi:hypothetical protein
MKLLLLALCSLTMVAPVLVGAESFPQLEPDATKYTQDRKTLDDGRTRQIDTARQRYIAALSVARAEAAKSKRGGAVAAIDAELADANSDGHAPTMPADLPRSLAGSRREFISAIEAIEKTVAARLKELNGKYIQTLTSLQQTAINQENAPLAEAVGLEKARILSTEALAVAPALHRNVIVNGDFSKTGADGLPVGWIAKGAGYQKDSVPWQNDALVVQEGSGRFLRFRRAASVRLANLAPTKPIMVPERAKAAVVSVRLRVEGLVPGKNYDRVPGVAIRALDATGASPGPVSASTDENTRWRNFTARLTLQPGAKTLELALGPWAAAGICDFDDVEVKFE